jgi:hypothetical protein
VKFGVRIEQPKPLKGFDLTFYEVKPTTGRTKKAANHVINVISCFGDCKTARERPEWIAVSKYGKAARANKRHRFLWEWGCPTDDEYNQFLLNLINETSKANIKGIHLDSIHFPRQEYCTCQRCVEKHEESNLGWVEWRVKIINDFVEKASKLVRGNGKTFSVTILPDPCFAKERFGLDFHALAKYVDFFIVPLYDVAYSTTYWVEILAYDFYKQLEKPLYIDLYAGNPRTTMKNLIEVIVATYNYADGIILTTYNTRLAEQIRDRLMKDDDLQRILEERGCESIINIIKRWKEGGDLHESDSD